MTMQSALHPDFNKQLELEPGNRKTAMRAIGKPVENYRVSPRDIRVIPGLNPRVKDRAYWEGDEALGVTGIIDLAKSMKANGFHEHMPLAGFVAREDGKDVLYLTEGHRRLDAALYWMDNLGGPEDLLVPLVPRSKELTPVQLNYDLRSSNQGERFRPYEDLMWALRMIDVYGQSEAMILAKSNISQSLLRSMLIVGRGPKEILELIETNQIAITVAGDMITKHGPEKAVELLTKAKALSAADGKGRISKRYLPGEGFKKVLAKKSSTIFDGVCLVYQDAGYSGLSDETRQAIEDMMAGLEEARAQLAEKEARALEKSALAEQMDEAEAEFERNEAAQAKTQD
ncbi:hypothetical protein [Marinobacter sp.]|uniref:hypothetical protein n=1 Tax=Marinobacter sp. TaxID=50741 RepID=UPI003A935695